MVMLAAFSILLTYICSALYSMPRDQLWRSNTFSPRRELPFSVQHKLDILRAGCWHIHNQINTTTKHRHVPKKHIRKKPILSRFTLFTIKKGGEGKELQGCRIGRRAIVQFPIIIHFQRRNWYIPTTLQPQPDGLLGLRLVGLEDDDDNFDGDLAAKTGTIDGAMMIKTTATPRLDYQSVYLPSSTVLLRLVVERFPWDRARHVVARDVGCHLLPSQDQSRYSTRTITRRRTNSI